LLVSRFVLPTPKLTFHAAEAPFSVALRQLVDGLYGSKLLFDTQAAINCLCAGKYHR
jgi:hypothetical protein